MISRIDRLLYWPAVGFGLGLVPIAPGTFGSLLGPPLVWLVWWYLPNPAVASLVAAILIFVGVPICEAGTRVIGKKDPGSVVWDEIVAFFVVFSVVPLTWGTVIGGFLLFRLFDVAKPWPIRRFEALPGGWGVMADDLIAAVYASALLWLFSRMVFPYLAIS